MAELAALHLGAAELVEDQVACHARPNCSERPAFGDSIHAPRFVFAERGKGWHIARSVKSLTIAINDLFEFEGQPVPAQRPDAAVIEGIARHRDNSSLPWPTDSPEIP